MKHSLSRRLGRFGFRTACLGVLALTLALAGCNGGDDGPSLGTLQLRTLSNRADLISDGDALVEVTSPARSTEGLSVTLNGADVTAAFAKRADGRIMGLVTGLKTGPNTLTAGRYC
jgi:hypothetical protein